MSLSLLSAKSYHFAIRILKLKQYLQKEHKEYEISKQVVRSGTAVGALIKEAEFAQSDADFIYKLRVALKEANETEYWLSLLRDTGYLTSRLHESLQKNCKELIAILVSSINKTKNKMKER